MARLRVHKGDNAKRAQVQVKHGPKVQVEVAAHGAVFGPTDRSAARHGAVRPIQGIRQPPQGAGSGQSIGVGIVLKDDQCGRGAGKDSPQAVQLPCRPLRASHVLDLVRRLAARYP